MMIQGSILELPIGQVLASPSSKDDGCGLGARIIVVGLERSSVNLECEAMMWWNDWAVLVDLWERWPAAASVLLDDTILLELLTMLLAAC